MATLAAALKEVILRNKDRVKPVRVPHITFQNGDRRGAVNVVYYPFDSTESTPLTQYASLRRMKSLVITHAEVAPRGGGIINATCDELLADAELAPFMQGIAIEAVLSDEFAAHLTECGWTEYPMFSRIFTKRKQSNA
jgi:hypothetical protein